MDNLNQIRHKADELIKAKNFDKALLSIEEVWLNHPDKIEEWDVWRYTITLKNLKRYEESLKICQKYADIYPNNESINNVHAWCLFYLKIRKNDSSNLEQEAQKIKKLASVNKPYTAYVPTAYAVLKGITNDIQFPAEKVLEWTTNLDFDQLSEQTYSFKQKGKNIEVASQKEYFLLWHTKALYFSEKYHECIDFAKSALKRLQKFHYSNDVWLKRLIAMSHHKLENYDDALDAYRELLNLKSEWFIHKEFAEIYFEMNELELAFKHAITSVENNIPLDKKVSAILLLAEILHEQGLFELSLKHYLLVYLIRKQNDWKIDKQLITLLKDNHLLDNNPEISYVKNKLSGYWQSQTTNTQEIYTGMIHNILSHGNAGFIKADKKSYYFKISDFKSADKYLNINQKVSFNLKEGFDKKKQIKTLNAVNVTAELTSK